MVKGCEKMGSHSSKGSKGDHDDCKNDCLCKSLKDFNGDEVTITTKTGDVITGELKNVKDCCVKIIVPGSVSPLVGRSLTVVRCEDIESYSVELLEG
jgi:small nuclear ribonucleoprotein (snRNP)-like protein